MHRVPQASLRTLLGTAEIQDRVTALGRQISQDYAGVPELRLVGVLKGAWMFLADLVRCIDVPVTCDFIGVSSYGRQTSSSGAVRLTLDLDAPIADLCVMLVEDIVDTGLTMRFLYDTLARHQPRDLRTCTLLDKPSHRRIPFIPDYIGFSIPDHFVVGYGLDVAGAYRNLSYIAIYQAPDEMEVPAL